MKSQSRIINSLKNTTIALLGQIINIVLQFVLRSVFIESIGIQYLGINGIFTNILSILSLTELGVGAALSIGMYKPLADNNVESIKAHINAYRKVYAIIGTILAVSGICIVPLLPYLIKDSNTINMLIPIYLLYLLDAVSTYFFAHFRAILSSNQQDYVNNINKNIFTFFQVIVQIICLVIYKNLLISSVKASIGNLCTVSEKDKINENFLNINFAYFWINGFYAICLAVLTTPFINIWLGKEYEMSKYT